MAPVDEVAGCGPEITSLVVTSPVAVIASLAVTSAEALISSLAVTGSAEVTASVAVTDSAAVIGSVAVTASLAVVSVLAVISALSETVSVEVIISAVVVTVSVTAASWAKALAVVKSKIAIATANGATYRRILSSKLFLISVSNRNVVYSILTIFEINSPTQVTKSARYEDSVISLAP